MIVEPCHVSEGVERASQIQSNIDGLLERVGTPREMPERNQRLLEGCRRFAVGGTVSSFETGPSQGADSLVPYFAFAIVDAEGHEMWVEVGRMELFERLGDLPMEQAATRAHELRVDDAPDPLVDEVEPARYLVHHLPADELFHARGRCRLLEPGRALEEAELEASPDDRPHPRQLSRHLAQPVELAITRRTRSAIGSPPDPTSEMPC